MKTPTLEEVKEKYKNAKEVRCLATDTIFELDFNSIHNDPLYKHNLFWANSKEKNYNYTLATINEFAEIISYIEPTTEVRNSVLLQLAENNSFSEEILKKECPKLFEVEKLQNNKWYKSTYINSNGVKSLFLAYIVDFENQLNYGFDFKGEFKTNMYFINDSNSLVLATPQEVETALKSEFEKQNYVKFNIYKFDVNSNILTGRDSFSTKEFELFKDGVFTDEFKTPTDIITIVEKYGKDKVQEYLNNAK